MRGTRQVSVAGRTHTPCLVPLLDVLEARPPCRRPASRRTPPSSRPSRRLPLSLSLDGYARAKGVAVLVVTFTVGGLSAINAVAGAYSDNLPLIVISGCPNSNDFGSERVLHHTIGIPNFRQTLNCYKQVSFPLSLSLSFVPPPLTSSLDSLFVFPR